MLNTLQNIQASKSDRKLYIGNLPANLTPQTVKNNFVTYKNLIFYNFFSYVMF